MKKVLVTISIMCLMGQLASAFVLSDKMVSDQAKIIQAKAMNDIKSLHKDGETPQCKDFSGLWQGQCRTITPNEDKIITESLNIVQEQCVRMKIMHKSSESAGESEIAIGALSSAATSNFSGLHTLSYFNWSEDGSTLKMNMKASYNLVFGNIAKVIPFDFNSSVYLEGNQLIAKSSGPNLSRECVYQRVK